jgi:hypothetical protein
MKINGVKYDTMKNAMQAVVNHFGGASAVKEFYKHKTSDGMLWALWHITSDNMRYDDTHPNFRFGLWTRIIPQNPSFDMYSDNHNDVHIATALRKIGKELGIA